MAKQVIRSHTNEELDAWEVQLEAAMAEALHRVMDTIARQVERHAAPLAPAQEVASDIAAPAA